MNKPIKRHEALKPLSRDHHHGLLLCWKIREGFKLDVAPERMDKYVKWFWSNHLVPHFESEEQYVFPILGNDHKLVRQALKEHKELKELFNSAGDKETLLKIEEGLQAHIRFEERILFNEIEKIATQEQLKIAEQHHKEPDASWDDEFWIKK